MKKIFFIIAMLCACLVLNAQENTTEYIYCSDGFEIKEGIITVDFLSQQRTYSSTGLYSADGKVLVAAITNNGFARFYVLDGCETICSGAFQGMTSTSVYIPSSVKYIAPDALVSIAAYGNPQSLNRFAGIQDGCTEDRSSTATRSLQTDPNATEVSRYNLQGMKLDSPESGINILQKSDGTTEKIMVR